MFRARHIFVVLGICALSALRGAPASAEITRVESFEPSAKTSLKVLEPTGAHVFVTVGKEVKDDTAPAIFPLANEDAYVVVKVVMVDGESWSGKVEIKARQQTVLRFAQKGKKPAPAAATKAAGRLLNTTDKCDWPINVRFSLIREGSIVFTSPLVFPGKESAVSVETGNYIVQVHGTTNAVLASRPLNVARDGWVMPTGCVKED